MARWLQHDYCDTVQTFLAYKNKQTPVNGLYRVHKLCSLFFISYLARVDLKTTTHHGLPGDAITNLTGNLLIELIRTDGLNFILFWIYFHRPSWKLGLICGFKTRIFRQEIYICIADLIWLKVKINTRLSVTKLGVHLHWQLHIFSHSQKIRAGVFIQLRCTFCGFTQREVNYLKYSSVQVRLL